MPFESLKNWKYQLSPGLEKYLGFGFFFFHENTIKLYEVFMF